MRRVKKSDKLPYTQCIVCGCKLPIAGPDSLEAMVKVLNLGYWLACNTCALEFPHGADKSSHGLSKCED